MAGAGERFTAEGARPSPALRRSCRLQRVSRVMVMLTYTRSIRVLTHFPTCTSVSGITALQTFLKFQESKLFQALASTAATTGYHINSLTFTINR